MLDRPPELHKNLGKRFLLRKADAAQDIITIVRHFLSPADDLD
jgi:hypothetical protein